LFLAGNAAIIAPMTQAGAKSRVTFRQALFLSVGVPLIFLLGLESLARLLNSPKWFSSKNSPTELEMPTWMASDENHQLKGTHIKADQDTLEWLRLFEEGPGFRVRLIPKIDAKIINTFSQLHFDKKQRFEVKANSLGFRGEEISETKAQDAFRILVFGDSSSFGWGVEETDRYDHVLQALLSKAWPGRKIETANFAIPGDSSEYGRLIFEKYAPVFKADLIIFGFGANDAKPVYRPHTEQVQKFRDNMKLQYLKYALDKSALYKTASLALGKLAKSATANSVEQLKKSPAVNIKRYGQNLEAMLQRTMELGTKRALVLTLCTPGEYAAVAKQAADKARALFLNGQAFLVGALPQIKSGELHPELLDEMQKGYGDEIKSNELFYITSDACHPNKLGQHLVGEKLAQIIQAESLP